MTEANPITLQMGGAWHDGGMFIGMHWIWWVIWICTIGVLLWALVRAMADRAETRRRAAHREAAEARLRDRFAGGEIDEEEYAHRMRILRDTEPKSWRSAEGVK